MDKVTLVHTRFKFTPTGNIVERIDLALTGEVQADEACKRAVELVRDVLMSKHFAHLAALQKAATRGLVTIGADRNEILVVPEIAAKLAVMIVRQRFDNAPTLVFESELAEHYNVRTEANTPDATDWPALFADIPV